jgi:hypothetical protein
MMNLHSQNKTFIRVLKVETKNVETIFDHLYNIIGRVNDFQLRILERC